MQKVKSVMTFAKNLKQKVLTYKTIYDEEGEEEKADAARQEELQEDQRLQTIGKKEDECCAGDESQEEAEQPKEEKDQFVEETRVEIIGGQEEFEDDLQKMKSEIRDITDLELYLQKQKSKGIIKDVDLNVGLWDLYKIIKWNNPFRIKWDLFVMLLSIWNSLTIPIEIAFEPPEF